MLSKPAISIVDDDHSVREATVGLTMPKSTEQIIKEIAALLPQNPQAVQPQSLAA